MARDAKTTGAGFWAEVLAKLPEEKRTAAANLFEGAEAAPALELLGGGVLRQTEFSKLLNDLTTKETELDDWKKNLDTWYTGKQAALVELQEFRDGKRRPAGDPVDPTKHPTVDPAKVVTPEQLNKTLEDTERGALVVIQDLN